MATFYEEFLDYFNASNKEKCVMSAIEQLENKKLDIVALYEDVLKRALATIPCTEDAKECYIWKEHVKSAIVRTIVECAYPYVVAAKRGRFGDVSKGTIAVLCPDGENHELGARMVSDFIDLNGYNTIYVGKSTPKDDFIDVLEQLDLVGIAISITNYYNLVATKRTIEGIREKKPQIPIYVGGTAFMKNPDAYKEIGADYLLHTFSDIQRVLLGGEHHETRT